MSDVERINCVHDECGTFVMDRELYERYKKSGKTFHCPAGHAQHFAETGHPQYEERIDELQSEIEQLEQKLEQAESRRESLYESLREERQKYKKEKDRKNDVLSFALRDEDGVVEIGGAYIWACDCGNHGRALTDDEATAWSRYDQHRENMHAEEGATA